MPSCFTSDFPHSHSAPARLSSVTVQDKLSRFLSQPSPYPMSAHRSAKLQGQKAKATQDFKQCHTLYKEKTPSSSCLLWAFPRSKWGSSFLGTTTGCREWVTTTPVEIHSGLLGRDLGFCLRVSYFQTKILFSLDAAASRWNDPTLTSFSSGAEEEEQRGERRMMHLLREAVQDRCLFYFPVLGL